MNSDFLVYLLKTGITFSIAYCVFYELFRHKTFHGINRLVLHFILFISLTIPALNVNWGNSSLVLNNNFVIEAYDGFVQEAQAVAQPIGGKGINYVFVIYLIYILGAGIFGFRLLNQLNFIYQLKKTSIKHMLGTTPVYLTKHKVSPFSFFYWIFLPEDEIKNTQHIHLIIEHERIHARQWHTIDLLIAELFSIFLWFVPFVYSFKHSIKNVHEYIADEGTMKSVPATHYLRLLGSYSEKYLFIGLTNNFYCSTLKKRITMITTNKTSKKQLLLYLAILPAMALILYAFNLGTTESGRATTSQTNSKTPQFIYPMAKNSYHITSTFGMRMHPIKKKKMMHKGMDFAAKTGSPVMACADGKIIKQEFSDKGHGNLVAIDHGNGYVTLYTQLSAFKSQLSKQVKQGDVIGLVGSSGISTGPHLHFELRLNNEPLDPEDYLK